MADRIMEIKTSNTGNIMASSFDKSYFDSLSAEDQAQLLKCCNSGIENSDSAMGCYAMNPTDYDKFKPFFQPVLEKYHKVDLSNKNHINNWDLSALEGLPEDGKLDVSKFGCGALSMRIRTARNLNRFPLPGAMTQEDRCAMENAMSPVFDSLIEKPEFGGKYVSLTPDHKIKISDELVNLKQLQSLMIKVDCQKKKLNVWLMKLKNTKLMIKNKRTEFKPRLNWKLMLIKLGLGGKIYLILTKFIILTPFPNFFPMKTH